MRVPEYVGSSQSFYWICWHAALAVRGQVLNELKNTWINNYIDSVQLNEQQSK
jgi:hypothetical protein